MCSTYDIPHILRFLGPLHVGASCLFLRSVFDSYFYACKQITDLTVEIDR